MSDDDFRTPFGCISLSQTECHNLAGSHKCLIKLKTTVEVMLYQIVMRCYAHTGLMHARYVIILLNHSFDCNVMH